MTDNAGPRQLRRLLDAVMAVGTDFDLPVVLRRIVDAGQELVGARYAALGVLDPTATYLTEFITSGMDDADRAAIGALPKGHGILGLLITSPQPLRLPDLNEHPDRFGFPEGHPPMRSFLGVPLFVRGEVFGNLYFTEKVDAEVFTDIDEELAVGLAAAAAIAIDNARLHERSQELSLIADRERLGHDLHDRVIQRVFATGLAMHTTVRLCSDPALSSRIESHIDDLDKIVAELRTAIFELDVHRLAGCGIREEVLAVVADVARALGFHPRVRLDGPIDITTDPDSATHLLAVLREALSNVARHAEATSAEVRVIAEPHRLALEVLDDGVGPGELGTDGNGLRNMRDRAELLGGDATVSPGPDGGTIVRWSVPITRR